MNISLKTKDSPFGDAQEVSSVFPFRSNRRHSILSEEGFASIYLSAEVLMLIGSSLLCHIILQNGFPKYEYVYASLMGGLLYGSLILLRTRAGLSAKEMTPLGRRLKYWLLTFISLIFVGFAFKVSDQFSRIWSITSFFAGALLISIANQIARSWLIRLVGDKKVGRRAVIYGGTERTHALISGLKFDVPTLDIVGVIDARNSRFEPRDMNCLRGLPLNEIVDSLAEADIQAVLIDLPWSAEKRIREVKRAFEAVNVDILLSPYHMSLYEDRYELVDFGRSKALALYTRPDRGLSYIVKMLLDRLGALALIVLSAPLLILTALAIRLESAGPILFVQPRQGFNNKPFYIYKFRSMYSNKSDTRGNASTKRNDSRVTRIGRIIRATSIDELPQIFNVLKGEMSLVGPRPHAFGSTAGNTPFTQVAERYAARHRVLPGMTGLAQVRGYRGTAQTEQQLEDRVASDLEYVQRWSLALDIEILFRTVWIVLNPKNAF